MQPVSPYRRPNCQDRMFPTPRHRLHHPSSSKDRSWQADSGFRGNTKDLIKPTVEKDNAEGLRASWFSKSTTECCLSGPQAFSSQRCLTTSQRGECHREIFILKVLKSIACVCAGWTHRPQHPCEVRAQPLWRQLPLSLYLGLSDYGCSTFPGRSRRSPRPGQVAPSQGKAPPRAFVFCRKGRAGWGEQFRISG